jgi:predicted DNA-binding transcriptional regulator YafY
MPIRTDESIPPKSEDSKALRWGVEKRMTFLEARLFWEGEVSRGELMERFGVSLGQASADIARYIALAPDNISYDKSRKRYVPTEKFGPVFGAPDASRYLSELHARQAGLLFDSFATVNDVPPADLVPVPTRSVDANILRQVIQAIRHHQRLDVRYQSFTQPKTRDRQIEPHALVFDGMRWHVRAFDPAIAEFRDFVLGRIYGVKVAGAAASDAVQDIEWQQHITLTLKPNPGLSEDQIAAVRHDYGFKGETLSLTIRRPLAFYVKRSLRLDLDPASIPPQHQHLVLVKESAR